MARKRWRGTTTQRGYGRQHQLERARLMAQFTPGQLCARCHQPIWDQAQIDLGHSADRTHYTGLEHRACNRADGARRKNRKQTVRVVTMPPSPWSPSRTW